MVRPEAAGSRSFLEVVAGTNNNVEVPAAEEAQAVVTIKAQVTVVAGRVTGELVAGEATATPAAPKKKTRKRVPKRRSELHSRLLALVKGQLLNRQQAQQKAQAAQETAKSRTEEEAEKVAQSQPLLVLPPSRKHATGAPEELVPHPVQVVEGYTVVYPVKEYELWTVMGEVEGWSLPLGEAEVRGGDVLARAAEEFSVVCGFSAAFGPLLLEHITAKVYEGTVVCGAKELPPEHLSHMFSAYWESEVAPFDSTERLFRLVSNPLRGGIGRVRG